MKDLGDWSDHDNKKYKGKIDRIYVSDTEEYEVEYFIDAYLNSRSYAITNKNRDIVAAAMEEFPGKAPHKRDDLNRFLDERFKKK